MPKPHRQEFRDDVIAVARKGEAPIGQIAKDFGISESCLRNWLVMAGSTAGVQAAPVSPPSRDVPPQGAV